MRIICWTAPVLFLLVGHLTAAEQSGVVTANPFISTTAARPHLNVANAAGHVEATAGGARGMRALPSDPIRALGAVVRVTSTKHAYPATAVPGRALNSTPSKPSLTEVTPVAKRPHYDPAVSQAAWISDDSSAVPPKLDPGATPQTVSSPAIPRLLPIVPAVPLVGEGDANPLRGPAMQHREAEKDGLNPLR